MTCSRHRTRLAALLGAAAVATTIGAPRPARAEDVWTTTHPGIQHLRRTAPGPHVVHAAVIDLSVPSIWLRFTRPGERGRTTGDFARSVGAAVAINGDWFESGFVPYGLAVGAGEHWADTADKDWTAFVACTLERECTFDRWGTLQELHWRWRNVVGGNQDLLVIDGVPQVREPAVYSTERHPRSAVGVSADGLTLILVVAQGRRSDSIGMTFNEMGALLHELGAHVAMMLDGGGSSTLVLDGTRVSALPDAAGGAERAVANHIAVVYSESLDPRCGDVPNGRFCLDATHIATCEGGRYEEGDCAFYGATCEVGDGIGYCVDYRCAAGGNGRFCLDATRIASCELGRYSEGDCAFYGATCEEGAGTAYCVDYRCEAGGNASFCVSESVSASCALGAYSERDCAAEGLVCGPLSGLCIDPACLPHEGEAWCESEVAWSCEAGAPVSVDCAAGGLRCEAGRCVTPGADGGPDGGGPDGGGPDGGAPDGDLDDADPDDEAPGGAGGGCGCGAPRRPDAAGLGSWLALLFLARRRRRREWLRTLPACRGAPGP